MNLLVTHRRFPSLLALGLAVFSQGCSNESLVDADGSQENTSISVIYGDDNRRSFGKIQDTRWQPLGRATAAMVHSKHIRSVDSTRVLVSRKNYGEHQNLCPGERFRDEPSLSSCTGFLVEDDLLLTAGHCLSEPDPCSKFKWIFGYDQTTLVSEDQAIFPIKNVYSCKKVEEQNLRGLDYALIRLDRSVTGRSPLQRRTSGILRNDSQLIVAGHPSGLPLKGVDQISIRQNHPSRRHFLTSADSFWGNSGSAVFDLHSMKVEGILVRGEVDFTYDSNEGCFRVKQCREKGCRGEDVLRITEIPYLNPDIDGISRSSGSPSQTISILQTEEYFD